MKPLSQFLTAVCLLCSITPVRAGELKAAVFDCDATPPPGSALTYDPMLRAGELSLRSRGVVLLAPEQPPVVLCAVDWIGIANEGYAEFRATLAAAAGTSPDRVALHALHQHDAPICDFTTEKILREFGKDPGPFRGNITRPLIQKVADAVRASLPGAVAVTHVGWGEAEVREVASNRRIFGPEGKVTGVRYTSCKDPALRAAPEGTVDPAARVITLWSGERPVGVLSSYATHPQSYYRTGIANPDYPGIARFLRGQSVPEALHIHFTGAGGDIGAGKYNDGSPGMRAVLAERLADGMERAYTATVKEPVDSSSLGWAVESVGLPVAPTLDKETLERALLADGDRPGGVLGPAMQLAWLRRREAGIKTDLTCLRLGSVRLLGLPGESFVEYQLKAAAMRPDRKVAVAAYGEYGPGYVCTRRSYTEGGYEVGPNSSFVAPEVEEVMLAGIANLLEK